LGVDAVERLLEHIGTTPYKRATLIGRFGFTDAAKVAAE